MNDMIARMKEPRNLLILLGFICQAFVWEDFPYIVLALVVALWFTCLRFRQDKPFILSEFVVLLFFMSSVFAFRFGGNSPFMRCLSVGNGLLVLQAIWLLWPLDRRQQIVSVTIAMVHLAIGSLVILDYSFILILLAAILLLPKVLANLEHSRFRGAHRGLARHRYGIREYSAIFVTMVIFFLVFPRRQFFGGDAGLLRISRGQMRAHMQTIGGGTAGSSAILFQIEGEDLAYLKSFSLDVFDGNNWKASDLSYAQVRRFGKADPTRGDMVRHVTVRNVSALGFSLPTDGYVTALSGNFFTKPRETAQGSTRVDLTFPTSNAQYEYWVNRELSKEVEMKPRALARYLDHPPVSGRMQQLLKSLTGNESDQFKQARILERYLQDNFTYQIGAPKLDRLAPVDDLIFNQKRGHCERYASALAAMLRMVGIPSRVAIGFCAVEENQLGEFYTVRAKHAHAWTEAFVKDKGWVVLDGTPFRETVGSAASDFALSLYDWIEFIWYSKIVNFSVKDQDTMFAKAMYAMRELIKLFVHNLKWMVGALFIIVLGTMIYTNRHRFNKGHAAGIQTPRERQQQMATHFYGRLLKALAAHGYRKLPHQTPFEFLAHLEAVSPAIYQMAKPVTELFCAVKYGQRHLTEHDIQESEATIRTIRKKKR